MNRAVIFCKILLLSLLFSTAVQAVPDFSLIDQQGRYHQLSRYADNAAVVIFSHSPGCPTSTAQLQQLVELEQRWSGQGVSFLLLVADADVQRGALREHAASVGVELPFLLDESQLVARSLGLTHAGEALVIDPVRMDLLYRGAIDDANARALLLASGGPAVDLYLDAVLAAVLSDGPVPRAVALTEGRPLDFDRIELLESRAISYADEVAPILIERCVTCHQRSGAAPWAMDSHRMVQGWSTMMRETLMTRRMPPGQVDPHHADRFVDVNHVTDEEMAILISWIDSGAGHDGEVDPLELHEQRTSGWALGEPDMVIELPPQRIPATGAIDYVFEPIELGLTEDRWVSAYAFDVDNKEALHHVILYTQDSRQQRQNASRGGSRTNFGGYAPGRDYVSFEDDSGILLQRDMRLMVQFHYTTIGRELTDRTRLGLYFHESPPRHRLMRTAVMNGDFVIPPGVREHEVSAEAIITEDSYLHSFAPHMHFRGKHIKFAAKFPDGRREELLSIPNFQHNWQMVYRLREPLFLPAGTLIEAEGAFDNSEFNPLNPDPDQEVRWGVQVWDEMFITWMRISAAE